mmetsp:Transcript_91109/g.199563  ORF Transcript_91109/g.199563 Transcript_91109/m.199563 type:complete len:525 (-) Transcript_91109:355-1929(-)
MTTALQDHYQVLGVPQTAAEDEIRRAYKRLALKWHPDKNPVDVANAEVMFKKIAVAYKVLKEPADRRQYDEKVKQQSQQQQQQQQRQYQQPQQQQYQQPQATNASGGTDEQAVQPRQGFFGSLSKAVGSVSERLQASRQAAREKEEAYNLFEEVFGKDPFKEVDSLFQDPSPERLDSFFSSLSNSAKQAGGQSQPKQQHGSWSQTNQHITGSSTSTSSTMVFGPQGMFSRTQDSAPQVQHQSSPTSRQPPMQGMSACHSQPPGHHPQPALPPGSGMGPSQSMPAGHTAASKCFRARCLAPNGVAFRRSAQVGDRLVDVRGPSYGDVIVMIDPPYKDWVRCAKGWLPITLNGMAVVEIFPPNCTLRARCIAPQGVGYRACMDLDNRLFNVRGPNSGDVVEVEELIGSWIRTPSGWLPIFIGGQAVLELLDELSPNSLQASVEAARRRAAPQPEQQQAPNTGSQPSRQSWSAPWFSSWSLAGLLWPSAAKMQVALVTVVGSSCYIGFKSFVFVLKTWKRAAFGWLF